jgi:hypothetical protein
MTQPHLTAVVTLSVALAISAATVAVARGGTSCVSRQAVGGGTITTCSDRVCWTRPAVGGGTITTCR